eukprot:403340669
MSSGQLYYTHQKMTTHLIKLKKVNSEARLLGMDIGRKYVGLALSDKQIKTCKPYKTLQMDPQFLQQYRFEKNESFFNMLKHTIRNRNVKGLVIGYPLYNMNSLQNGTMCQFIEKFIEYMWQEGGIKLPVTLINEQGSSLEAKARLSDMISGGNTQLNQSSMQRQLGSGNILNDKMLELKVLTSRVEATQTNTHVRSLEVVQNKQVSSMMNLVGDLTNSINTSGNAKQLASIDPDVMLRKGVYDKIAAQVILQEFLTYYNKEVANQHREKLRDSSQA